DRFPQWAADGRSILFASNRGGRYELFAKEMFGTTREQPVRTRPEVLLKWTCDWRSDRGLLAYTAFDPATAWDVWLRTGEDQGVAVVNTSANEGNAALSPDGR